MRINKALRENTNFIFLKFKRNARRLELRNEKVTLSGLISAAPSSQVHEGGGAG